MRSWFLAESLVVMLGLLFTVLDEVSRHGDGSKLKEYLQLVEEAEGLDRTLNLMNEHEDMQVYDKVRHASLRRPSSSSALLDVLMVSPSAASISELPLPSSCF